ncbi:hypothetical protein HYT24_03460 [Candidatus Pacearchaeota archaeon]|nr:hypothetical protein [Candidatus Pacearchaeota archaeon]
MKRGEKSGQVWIETVIYTLIALTMIGAVLVFITPKIKETQDRAVIEQTLNVLQNIDGVVASMIQGGPGNKRIVNVGIKEGTLEINGANDTLTFELQTDKGFSEEGKTINIGGIDVLTKRVQNIYYVTLTKNYSNYDVKFEGKNEAKTLTQGTTPYMITIENKGGTKTVLDFTIN